MSVECPEGKRIGRPKGSKSRPWLRDAAWAYRNLDRSDAEPPSPQAAYLLALGRDDPAKLISCLAACTAEGNGAAMPVGPAKWPEGNARIFMPKRLVDRFLRSMYARVPEDAIVVGVKWDGQRKGAIFDILTHQFPDAVEPEALHEFRPPR